MVRKASQMSELISLSPGCREEVLRRLHCVQGHTRGVSRMVNAGTNGLQVVHQLGALRGALNTIALLLLEDLLRTSLQDNLTMGEVKDRDKLLADLSSVCAPYMESLEPAEVSEGFLASEGEMLPIVKR